MGQAEQNVPGGSPAGGRGADKAAVGGTTCIVMVCAAEEADQIGRQLSQLDRGCLVTYRRVEDMVLNAPTGKVSMVILAGQQETGAMRRTLRWLRHRWPSCPVAVVGDTGGDSHEMTARKGGALYLARPVRAEYWSAMVSHLAPSATGKSS